MRIEAITSKTLGSFLKTHLASQSFMLFVHIITNPFIKILCNIPNNVKEVSSIYLDREKYKINDYAVYNLRKCGYRNIYYVNKLHTKLLITEDFVLLGSANYTKRAVFSNYEIIFVIWKNYRDISGLITIINKIKQVAEPASVLH